MTSETTRHLFTRCPFHALTKRGEEVVGEGGAAKGTSGSNILESEGCAITELFNRPFSKLACHGYKIGFRDNTTTRGTE